MPRKTARPHVAVNMAMSLDGKISTFRREHLTLGTEHDRRLMDELRSRVDAVIVGSGTVKWDGFPILIRYKDLEEKRTARGLSPHPVNITMSRGLDFPTTREFFQHPDTRKIVFTTGAAPERRVKLFSRYAEVVVLPGRNLSPRTVLNHLHRRKFKMVLLEGGGALHFAFARDDAVDDIYITLTPRLIGGATAPTTMDGKGFLAAGQIPLRLVSTRRVEDELFLKYRVDRAE
jgi:2,5-diamino-6-(ribosylamino)-4(3H)-pyrimidinone 5'-phosphate reductase